MLNYGSQEFKSLEELREIAPSIFTQVGSENTSDKYTHIPTDQVIKDMELLGWGVVDAKEVKARKETTVGFQKHLVVFRNNDVVIWSRARWYRILPKYLAVSNLLSS